ncbi:hypothetical protein LEMLEM_LOCUS1212, partial [Lemmus lemmus]
GRVELGGENYTECWEKKVESERNHVAPQETDAGTLPGQSRTMWGKLYGMLGEEGRGREKPCSPTGDRCRNFT